MILSKIKVIELFAGVGGFRLGLEGWKGKSSTSRYKEILNNKIPFQVVYSNQWEPSTKTQHANDIYVKKFTKSGHFDIPIQTLTSDMIETKCDLLVGGFPCPDFSVGALLKYSKGLKGKKGELWYQITRLLEELKKSKRQPEYLLFENVDRMLSSPSQCPGKDFKTILQSLYELDYNVEWKVINASDYGFMQKRKRVFMFCFHKKSKISEYYSNFSDEDILINRGVISSSFPCEISSIDKELDFGEKILDKFKNSGIMINGKISEYKTSPNFNGKYSCLGNALYKGKIDDEFYLNSEDIEKWNYIKGSKKIPRTRDGYQYIWSEGSIPFPDDKDMPSRTIITSEGGGPPSRTKHVIREDNGRLRRLIPIEIERLNMFPDNFTKSKSTSDIKRAYLMGNALVVGIIERIGSSLSKLLFELG